MVACTKTEGDPGLGNDSASSDDSGSGATRDAAGNDEVVGSGDDGGSEDASMRVTGLRDSGRAETGAVAADGSNDTRADAPSGGDPETGRLAGITAAHNAVRAMVSTQPGLPSLTWSPTLAAYAQEWATQLASDPSTCAAPVHRSSVDLGMKDYGENLAAFSGRGATGAVSTAEQVVDAWAAEVSCWT